MSQDASIRLLARWRAGDQQAAEALFERYADQLVKLARKQLPGRLSPRVDAEDVVQSVYRTFFAAARAGRYELQRGGDLWRLLVTITTQKLHNQIKFNKRDKRTVEREVSPGSSAKPLEALDLALAHEPSPLEATALADKLEAVMRGLSPVQRRMLELRLQGYNLEEIAAQTDRSVRSVSRALEQVKGQLEHDAKPHPSQIPE